MEITDWDANLERALITHEFRLDEIKQAFEMQLNTDEAIKVVVKP